MRKFLVVAILLCIVSSVMAEDFSVTLQKAKPWPGKTVYVSGMQSRTAPANSLTAVQFWTKGWITGTNGLPMTVYAVPRQQENGIWWAICQVSAYCGNPAKGGWLERKEEPKPLTAAVSQVETRVETRTEIKLVEVEVERPCPPALLPPPMVGGREVSPGYPIIYGTRSERWVPLAVPFVFSYEPPKYERHCPPPPPPPTCPPGGSPPPEQNPSGCNVLPTDGGSNTHVPPVPPPPSSR